MDNDSSEGVGSKIAREAALQKLKDCNLMAEEGSNSPNSLDALISLIQAAGYRAKLTESREAVLSMASGLNFLAFAADGTLQLRCGLAKNVVDIDLSDVNKYNETYRFSKLYIDDEGDIMLEADFLFDIDNPSAQLFVDQVMNMFEGAIGELKMLMHRKRDSVKS